jgi:hypothetical protein
MAAAASQQLREPRARRPRAHRSHRGHGRLQARLDPGPQVARRLDRHRQLAEGLHLAFFGAVHVS